MNAKKKQNGQAIVELTVSLVGILAIFCGFLLISKLSLQNVDNVVNSRSAADDNAINSVIVNPGSSTSSWDNGPDNYMYTADDVRVSGVFADPVLFSGELQNDIFSLKSDLSVSDNFAPRLEEPGFIFINAAELTSGSSSSTVSLDDLEKVLFYLDTPSITLRDEIYMPLTDKPVN